MVKKFITHSAFRSLYRCWWEHRYGVLPNDVFLVSYPRSGNTWVRFMLLQARPEFQPSDFQRIDEIIPDMHGKKTWFLSKRTNIVKSHLTYWQPFRKVIYLVRDGRAAVHSNWRYQRDEGRFQGSFEDFLSHPHWPSSWSEHVRGWVNAPETQLIIRYEEIVANPSAQLLRIAAVLGWPLSAVRAEEIVASSTKETMQAMEEKQCISLHRVSASASWKQDFTPSLQSLFLKSIDLESSKYLT
jgi:hypothetical protein